MSQRPVHGWADVRTMRKVDSMLFKPLRDVEQEYVQAVLDYTEGNIVRAADILKVNRRTIQRQRRKAARRRKRR